jgi:peptide/nickel transport system permease protein
MTKAEHKADKPESRAPSFFIVVWREIVSDKLALISLIFLIALFMFVYIAAANVDSESVVTVSLKKINQPPTTEHILGTDPSGRDMFTQLVVGARNSISIAIGITLLCGLIGTIIGLFAGFYGGLVDNIVMRIIDFFSMLPTLMLVIVVVSVIPKYNVITFILILSAFGWIFNARLTRAKTLQQGGLDYVSAARTLGTPNWKIMFAQVLPNIISIVIVNLTLSLAGNMGIEVGLSFLGFGLPFGVPSLGTHLSYARVPENLRLRWWLWMPAALLIVAMMLCINFVGQAVKRAADAKQRIS